MQVEWRHAGEEMLANLRQAQGTDCPDVHVADWVVNAYQTAVRGLIDGRTD